MVAEAYNYETVGNPHGWRGRGRGEIAPYAAEVGIGASPENTGARRTCRAGQQGVGRSGGWGAADRKVVIETIATRYARVDKAGKGMILDELCAVTGWHRNHARKVLKASLHPKPARHGSPRKPKYGPEVIAALSLCWSVVGMPTGKRLAPILPELVGTLRRFGELDIDEDTAALLVSMSAATIDRRLAPERRKRELKDRACTNPGLLFKSPIWLRAWAGWDDAKPGFVNINLVSHEGNGGGEHAWTLTATDVATGWTEKRSIPGTARKWVLAALDDIVLTMPFTILGVDSDNRWELVNEHLRAWCEKRRVTFSRSWQGNKSADCRADQSNWWVMRSAVGYYRYDTAAELVLLNKVWELQSKLTNYFYPHQRLVSKVRIGGKVSKRFDIATTPHRRVERHETVSAHDKAILADTCAGINPVAVQRQIQAIASELRTLATSKAGPKIQAVVASASTRASSNGSTGQARQCQGLPPRDACAIADVPKLIPAEVNSVAAEVSTLSLAAAFVGVSGAAPTYRNIRT